ncbi:hypothetical protein F4814DRAFT_402037 [Daldinia grandis]|nr:hypothetical protein F4814DRAFT_402037 [Daldinia grandis]
MSDTLNISARIHRTCGNGGLLCDSSLPSIGATVVPLADIVGVLNANVDKLTGDEEHKEYLACPFWKHDPDRYRSVKNSCTDGFGFKNIGKLTEHIKRVHCLWNGCENCRKRFNKAKREDVDEVKRMHMVGCIEPARKLTKFEAEWMDKDQDEAYGQLNFQKDKGSPFQCYEKICRAIWGPDPKIEIQEPYHLPGFQMSILRWQVFKDLEILCRQRNIEGPHPNNARHDATTVTVSPNLQNVDPKLLSRHNLDHLSSDPPPFYRGQEKKDSGVWSWGTGENNPTFAKPTPPKFAPYDDRLDKEKTVRAHNDLDYLYTAGTSAGLPESYLIPDGEFEMGDEGDFNNNWQMVS